MEWCGANLRRNYEETMRNRVSLLAAGQAHRLDSGGCSHGVSPVDPTCSLPGEIVMKTVWPALLAFPLVLIPPAPFFRQGVARAVGITRTSQKYTPLDLQPKTNQKLKDDFHGGHFKGNNLAVLPAGEQKFGGVPFVIGPGLIQLGSTELKDRPLTVEGIAVGRSFRRLHILHATGYQAPEGTVVGSYTVHYADKSKATIELAYGKDFRDWWNSEDGKEASRARIVWEGRNEAVKGLTKPGCKIRLFLMTWTNPHPKKQVTRIDFSSTGETRAAPFCVGMTVEEK